MRLARAVGLACMAGCGDKDAPVDTGPVGGVGGTGGQGGTTSPSGDCALQGLSVSVPDDSAPLALRLVATTTAAATLDVSWTDGDHAVSVSFEAPATAHDHALLGFRAGRTYTVTAEATAGACTQITSVDVVVEALPSWFPDVDLVVPASGAAPGETLMAIRTPAKVEPAEIEVVVDPDGAIVWVKDVLAFNQDAQQRESGAMLTLTGVGKGTLVQEWDWAGVLLRSWGTQGGGADTLIDSRGDYFHHDVATVAGTTDFVGLTRYGLPVVDWPVDYDDPLVVADATIADDVLVWFTEDGAVLGEVLLSEILPVDRIGYDSLDVVQPDGWADWAHANAIEMDTDGHVLVSLRHLDCVVKLNPVTGALDWILGNHDNWDAPWQEFLLEPLGADFRWPYHQHASGRNRLVATSTYTMFDNGNYQASPHTGVAIEANPVSRLVQYTVDPVAMTVVQDWSFEETTVGRLFSYAVGEADILENGNVLGTFGFLTGDEGGTNLEAGRGENSARIIEIDPTSGAERWHVHLSSDVADNPDGWTVYRAHRIPAVTGRVID